MGKIDWPREGRHILVGGGWVELKDRDRIPAISPIDEEIIGYIAAARGKDVDQAIGLIEPCLDDWAGIGVAGRVGYLKRFAEALSEYNDELAELETLDAGFTAEMARRNVRGGIESLLTYAGYANVLTGRTYATSGDRLAFTLREPYGIVARIIPFNHPINFALSFAAPVLLAGNAVILKPPEQASLSALAMAEVAREIFPPGVFNVITGYGAEVGTALVSHPAIPRIGFTGSVPTARRILEAAATHIKHVSLELGGKNALIVTQDADPAFGAKAAFDGMNFAWAGQSCQSTSRVLVCNELYDEVVAGLADRMGKLVVGDPRDSATDTPPLAFKSHYDRVREYVALGTEEGATLVIGGTRPEGFPKGFYLAPALFSNVTEDMRIAREEIFGPVVVAMRYKDQADAIRIANNTEYGLTARVIAGSLDEALAIASKLKVGTTWLNTTGGSGVQMPFGGYKESGLGRQYGVDEVLSYMEEKSVVAGL